MERDLYKKLKVWKSSPRRKPLVLEGARQVGKTYLIKQFATAEYADFAYFNFDADPTLNSLFQGRLDPTVILEQLSAYNNRKITKETLIFFDEIQESPNALNSLKYFCEEANEYHIISAGSLLGIKLTQVKTFPVGKVNFLHLYPMNFFEFLDALDQQSLRQMIEQKNSFTAVAEAFHQVLVELLKKYYFVGGMPEAVSNYLVSHDFNTVREVQNEILKSYALDFSKHAPPHDVVKISRIWESIPLQLAKENKKFTFSSMAKNARAREYDDALQWLVDAGLIYQSCNISVPALPLRAYAEKKSFKIYLLDVGLLGTMVGLTPKILVEGNQLFTHFKGAFVENYVAQELTARHEEPLFYWSSPGMAEVDFIFGKDEKILPLEVKSGVHKKSRSLAEYVAKYHPSMASRTTLLNFGKTRDVCNFPLYGIALFPALFKEADSQE